MARPRNGALMDTLRRLSVDQWIVYLLYGATVCIPLLPLGGNVLVLVAGILALLFDRQRFLGPYIGCNGQFWDLFFGRDFLSLIP